MAEVEVGNLKILNVTKTLATLTEDSFIFTCPPGGSGLMKEATFHLFRGGQDAPTAQGPNTADPYTSDLIRIKQLSVMKLGSSERVNLLSGSPNIKEFAGDGRLSKLFTVIETVENNEDIEVLVRNDDAVDVEVSLTLWLAVQPRERQIAAQPAR